MFTLSLLGSSESFPYQSAMARQVFQLAPPSLVVPVVPMARWDTARVSAIRIREMPMQIWSMEMMWVTYLMVLPWTLLAMPWIILRQFLLIHTHRDHLCREPILWMTWAICPMEHHWTRRATPWIIRRTLHQIPIHQAQLFLSQSMLQVLATSLMAHPWPWLGTTPFRDSPIFRCPHGSMEQHDLYRFLYPLGLAEAGFQLWR